MTTTLSTSNTVLSSVNTIGRSRVSSRVGSKGKSSILQKGREAREEARRSNPERVAWLKARGIEV